LAEALPQDPAGRAYNAKTGKGEEAGESRGSEEKRSERKGICLHVV